MRWATFSSRSWLCWLCRASPSLAAKSIISLILVLTIWWCPFVESSPVVGRGCLLWPVCSPQSVSVSLFPASFCTPRPNLPVNPGNFWLPTFAFQSSVMKRTSFILVFQKVLEIFIETFNFRFFGFSGWSIELDYFDIEWFARIILVVLRLHPCTAFQTLLSAVRATPFLLIDSCPQS